MNREAPRSGVTGHLQEIIQRHRAYAMRRYAEPCASLGTLPPHEFVESIRVIDKVLRARRDEPRLARIWFLPPTRSHVCSSEQGDLYADFSRSPKNLFCKQVAILIRSAIGGMVQVVKL